LIDTIEMIEQNVIFTPLPIQNEHLASPCLPLQEGEKKYNGLSLEEINMRIEVEFCNETFEELTDAKLMSHYMNCISVKNKIETLDNILKKHNINEETKQNIIQEYMLKLIPAGTKGVIRGNKFNCIVKQMIEKMKLDTNRFEVCFEKKCESHLTAEIPDWYILEKSTNKIIIGMNQLDLWGGGHQTNRGSKYIEDIKHNNEKSKLLCVVCNKIQFKSKKNKAYKLFEIGFENNTLCYVNNLQNIILYFYNSGLNLQINSCFEMDLGPTVLLNS